MSAHIRNWRISVPLGGTLSGRRRAMAPAPDFAALVGTQGWERLSPAIRRRFAAVHGPSVTYTGAMSAERSKLGLCFAVASKLFGGPLPVGRVREGRAEVEVYSDGVGGVVWDRSIRIIGWARPAQVVSTKRAGPDGALLECVRGGLGMLLSVFEADGALVFESRRYFFQIGRIRLPIPGVLTPGRCRVVHTHIDDQQFRFTMDMRHPRWGQTFHQSGVFHDPEG